MNPLQKLVEERISEAMQKGEFENLPGRGKPLDLDEDAHVPTELRMAYRMLKRANIPPEEVLMAKGVSAIKAALEADNLTPEERDRLKKRLRYMDLELNMRLEDFRKRYGGI